MNIDNKYVKAIYRSAPTPFVVIDVVKNEFIFSSGLLEKILGYSTQELNEFAKGDFKEIFHPEDRAGFEEIKEKHMLSKEGEVVKSIIRLKSADGQYHHFQVYDSVVERDENGAPVKIASVAEDITSEAEVSEKLKKAVSKIEKIMFTNSHELRGPVASILGIVNLFDESCFQNKYQKDLLEHLGNAVRQLDRIIGQITEEASKCDSH